MCLLQLQSVHADVRMRYMFAAGEHECPDVCDSAVSASS